MKTVLTVDDSKVVRTMVSRHLQPYGCKVLEATNGQEGVAAAREHKPDLVLLDVTMPVMDGRQALAELRKDAACKAIPVIMLTAESGRDLVVEIARLGVSGYIVKPFQQATFEKEVSKVLGAPGAAAAAATPPALDPHAVLVIDDSERVLAAAKAALEGAMTVLTALSGKEGIEQYRKAHPGIVVVDLAMPDMDGFTTLTELKKLGTSSFVALAVRGDSDLHDKARKAGYGAVVDKPFQPAELLEHVLGAAIAIAPPEEILKSYLGEEESCPVLDLAGAGTKALMKIMPLLKKKLRALAEDGNDRLIIDVARLTEVSSEQVACLAHLLADAGAVGIRTAICTANENVLGRLRQIAETSQATYAASRAAARGCLQ